MWKYVLKCGWCSTLDLILIWVSHIRVHLFHYVFVYSGELAARLQEASVKIISRNTCNKLYDDAVTPRMLCAGNLQGGVDACQVSGCVFQCQCVLAQVWILWESLVNTHSHNFCKMINSGWHFSHNHKMHSLGCWIWFHWDFQHFPKNSPWTATYCVINVQSLETRCFFSLDKRSLLTKNIYMYIKNIKWNDRRTLSQTM